MTARSPHGKQARPLLSVVATARNDDHGGDLIYRMGMFAKSLVDQCERYGLAAELVIVEWNPPSDRPRLRDAMDWPVAAACPIRFIEVPHELHATLDHADRLPLFQMIAKNVGIRRAYGRFVLATNVDVILSDELARFLATSRLEEDVMYRCDRHDVTADIPLDAPLDERLRMCAERVIRISRRDGTLDLRDGTFYRIYRGRGQGLWPLELLRHSYWHAQTRLGAVWRGRRLRNIPRWALRVTRHWMSPEYRGGSEDGDRAGLLAGAFQHYRTRYTRLHRQWQGMRARVPMHTNASGDFTLMSTTAWERTGGYRELEMYSMHIDGLVLFQGHHAGLREVCLSAPIYHLEHDAGFKPEPDGAAALNERLAMAAIPQISNDEYVDYVIEMHLARRPITGNRPTWGFSDLDLPEAKVEAVDGR